MGIMNWLLGTTAPVEVEKAAEITSAKELASFVQEMTGASTTIADFDYSVNIRAAYLNNVISAYCLQLIRTNAITAEWEVYNANDDEVDARRPGDLAALTKLLSRPNPDQSWSQFVQLYLTHRLLAGEAFMYRLPNAGAIRRGNGEVRLIEPNYITIQPKAYQITPTNGAGSYTVATRNPDKSRDICHVRDWHPSSARGLSRLAPAWASINNYNLATQWNSSVLANSSKLSMVAVIKSFTGQAAKGGTLAQETADQINRDLKRFSSPEGRGKPLVLGGDIDIKEFGMNPQEMEFIKGQEAMARNIALAFGVDPVLLGLPGDTAYNNKKQAMSGLFKLTIMPLLEELKEELEFWFKEIIPGEWRLDINLDTVIALEEDRASLWERQAQAAGLLTVNERRAMLGYEPIEGGDVLQGVTPAAEPPEPEPESEDNINNTDNDEEEANANDTN